jgi:hypothetical protein
MAASAAIDRISEVLDRDSSATGRQSRTARLGVAALRSSDTFRWWGSGK